MHQCATQPGGRFATQLLRGVVHPGCRGERGSAAFGPGLTSKVVLAACAALPTNRTAPTTIGTIRRLREAKLTICTKRSGQRR